MNLKSKPLTIFLFNGCSSPVCRYSKTILIKYQSRCVEVISENVPTLRGQELNVIISEGRTIRGMNRRFRRTDTATDVLSFPLGDEVIGEVWLCPSVVEQNAKHFGQPFENELLRVCIHGILHLAGFDHENTFPSGQSIEEMMFVLQEKILLTVISSGE